MELEYRTAVREAAFSHPTPHRLLTVYEIVGPDADGWDLFDVLECLYEQPLYQVRLLGDFLNVPPPDETPVGLKFSDAPWSTSAPFRLFISHHSGDKSTATRLKDALTSFGIEGFVAHVDIRPSKKWLQVIEAALATADGLVALVGGEFRNSEWCDQEAGWCMARGIPIVPVMLVANPPHGFLGQHQAVRYVPEAAEDYAREVTLALLTNDRARPLLELGIARAFATSGSFDEAKARCSNLAMIKSWNPKLHRIVEEALTANRQLREAWGVPEQARGYAGLPSA